MQDFFYDLGQIKLYEQNPGSSFWPVSVSQGTPNVVETSVVSRVRAPNNLQQSASSHYGSYSGGGSSSCFKLDICPDLLLAGLVAAFAAIFYLLHTAITMKGRKKRRSLSFNEKQVFHPKFLWDMVNLGNFKESQPTLCQVGSW